MKLPRRKFILLILAGLFVIGTGFLIFAPAKKSEKIKQETSLNQPVIAEEINKDSDGDGLKDWEEALWKTDPNNPDTDKDSIPDGQEVKENRNPLLAGNGKTDKIEGLKAGKTTEETDSFLSAGSSLSLTDAIAKQLFSDYLNFKLQKEGEMTEADKKTFLDSFVQNFETSALKNQFSSSQNVYKKSDIKILINENQDSIKDYGNNLALIIKKHFDPIPEDEIAIFKEATEKEDKEKLKELSSIISAYKNSAEEMLSLPAPLSFSENHLALINKFSAISEDLNTMQKVFEDPLGAIFAIKKYSEDALSAYNILAEINTYFWGRNITFDKGEAGKYFEHYLN